MPIRKDNKKRDWAEKIDQKQVDLYKKREKKYTRNPKLYGENNVKE